MPNTIAGLNSSKSITEQMAELDANKMMERARLHQMKVMSDSAVEAAKAAERNLAQSMLNSMTEAAKNIRF
jgi:hypothetical protein